MNLFWEFVGGKPTMFDWMISKPQDVFWFNAIVVLTGIYIVVGIVVPNKAK